MSNIQDGWVKAQRQRESETRRFSCPVCKAALPKNLEDFKAHVQANISQHGGLEGEAAITEAFKRMALEKSVNSRSAGNRPGDNKSSKKRAPPSASAPEDSNPIDMSFGNGDRDTKKLRSPPPDSDQPQVSSPTTPSNKQSVSRSRVKNAQDDMARYPSGARPTRQLYDPGQDSAGAIVRSPKGPFSKGNPQQHPGRGKQTGRPEVADTREETNAGVPPPPNTSLTPQPETKPISHEQLVAEVKGIYAGLVMIETKCIEVDNAQTANTENKLNKDQWQALIALHRTLLHEHHDFFLASQHPAANAALRRLASKYAMPARMWRHGIHSFLELLRRRLPDSYEYMLTFIYLAYSMMALLYETVPNFEDTWIECLGDLARYRMAIEDNDLKDRETWTEVAREWYCLASEKAPTTGRLYHHLAILARPNATQQLYYYTKSLCVVIPFSSARESIMTLFDPVLNAGSAARLPAIDAAFVRVHGIFFANKNHEMLEPSMEEYLGLLDSNIHRLSKKWLEVGYYTAIPLCCGLLGYGLESHFIMKEIPQQKRPEPFVLYPTPVPESRPDEAYEQALTFTMRVFQIVGSRFGDVNTLPFIHAFMVFMNHLSKYPKAISYIQAAFPWELCATMLNHILQSCDFTPRIENKDCPGAMEKDIPRPLPEDYAMRGMIYAEDYFPNGNGWFKNSKVEDDEKHFEIPSMCNQRKERILWLGKQISRSGNWLTWNASSDEKFGVAEKWVGSRVDHGVTEMTATIDL